MLGRSAACRSSRACSGACSAPPSAARHEVAPRPVPARHHDLSIPGAFAMTETGHGSDVASHRHDGDLRPGHRGVRHPHAVPRRRGRTTSATRPCTARPPSVFAQLITQRRQPRRARLLRAAARRRRRVPPRHRRRGRRPQGRPQRHRQRPAALRPRARPAREPAQPLRRRRGGRHVLAPIASPGRRFFTMLGTLVQGRVSLDGAATAGTALGLTSRSPTRNQRRQFDCRQRHRRGGAARLPQAPAPPAARCSPRPTRSSSRTTSCCAKFDGVFSGKADTDDDREDLETLAAALKPLSTWHALDTPAGVPRGLRRRRLPRREPAGRAARTTSTCTSRSRATTTCCCSSSASGCSPTTPSSSRGGCRRARPLRRRRRPPASAYHGTGLRQLGADGRRLRLDRPLGRARAARPTTQRELLTDRVETMIADIAGSGCARHPSCRKAEAAALFNAQPERAHRGGPRPRASCCSGRRSPTRSTQVAATRARSRCSPGCATCSASA